MKKSKKSFMLLVLTGILFYAPIDPIGEVRPNENQPPINIVEPAGTKPVITLLF